MVATEGPTRPKRLSAPLRRGPVRRAVVAYLISETGDGLTLVAVPLIVYGRTGNATLSSALLGGELVLGLLLGMAGGVLADRLPRRGLIISTYLARGALLIGAAALYSVPAVACLGVLARGAGALDKTASDASLPALAEGDYQLVTAVRSMARSCATTFGPVLGGVVTTVFSGRAALLLDALSFAGAAMLLRAVRELDGGGGKGAGQPEASPLADLRAGLAAIAGRPDLRRLMSFWAVSNFLVALCIAAALPYLVTELGAPGWTYGVSLALFSTGTIISLAVAGSHSLTRPWHRILLLSGVVYGLVCLAGVAVPAWGLFAGSWFAWGLAFGPEHVTCDVYLAESTPNHLRGRTYSGVTLLASLGSAVGYAVAGPLVGWASARVLVAAAGGGYLLAAPAFFLRRRRTAPAWAAPPCRSPSPAGPV